MRNLTLLPHLLHQNTHWKDITVDCIAQKFPIQINDFDAHLDPALRSWIDLPCVLCGHGDYSVQHWMRFCPVPALVGSALLNRPWRTHDWSLRPTFSSSRLAAIGVGAQLVHERSGLLPPLPPPPLHLMILFVPRNTFWIVFTHLFRSILLP